MHRRCCSSVLLVVVAVYRVSYCSLPILQLLFSASLRQACYRNTDSGDCIKKNKCQTWHYAVLRLASARRCPSFTSLYAGPCQHFMVFFPFVLFPQPPPSFSVSLFLPLPGGYLFVFFFVCETVNVLLHSTGGTGVGYPRRRSILARREHGEGAVDRVRLAYEYAGSTYVVPLPSQVSSLKRP